MSDDPRYGGFLVRAIAMAIDAMIVTVMAMTAILVVSICYLIMLPSTQTGAEDSSLGLVAIAVEVGTMWAYHALQESRRHATFGKRMFRLRVTDLTGAPIDFNTASVRILVKMACLVVLGVPYLLAAVTSRKQALHDFAAGTLVVVHGTEAALVDSVGEA